MFVPNLDLLRCPFDPAREAKLERRDAFLACVRCGTRFAIESGIPNLVTEEAHLPPDCTSTFKLPCRQPAQPS